MTVSQFPPSGSSLKGRADVAAEIVDVIRVVSVRGLGTEDDPMREIVSWFNRDGSLIAEHDIACTERDLLKMCSEALNLANAWIDRESASGGKAAKDHAELLRRFYAHERRLNR